ncbi:MAG: hypothetical protein IBX68_10010 [Dehalococcoidia bacterium]|nr:hypothetical protein [Dehalococcoidia bacterium]
MSDRVVLHWKPEKPRAKSRASESVAEEIKTHIARFAQTDAWLRENPPEVYVPVFSQPAFETAHQEPICSPAG